jgi:hypothetical protein
MQRSGAIMADRNNDHDVVDYISAVTAELAQMAAAQHYGTLAHVLEMAWLESEQLRAEDEAAPPRLDAAE